MQMYPGWSARDNYALHKKRKRRKAPKEEEETTKTYPTSASPVITTIATSVSSEEVLGEYPINRQARPKGLISAEAKKLATLSKYFNSLNGTQYYSIFSQA